MEQLPRAAEVQQPSGWLVMATQLLGLSSSDLAVVIHREASENPALEVEEHPHCLTCGQPLQEGFCPECRFRGRPAEGPRPPAQDGLASWPGPASTMGTSDDAFDAPLFTEAPVSLPDLLTRALQAELPAEDGPIIEYLVGSLDAHGYMREPLALAARVLRVPLSQVERVLEQLQTLDPPGIGARDVRECLLLQLRALEADGPPHPVARAVVDRFLDDLGRGHYSQIARQLGLPRRAVEEAHAFIRRHLAPFPALGHLEGRTSRDAEELRPAVPDVIIRRRPPGEMHRYEVEVVEQQRFALRIDPAYVEAYQHARGHGGESAEEQAQLEQAVGRARFFLSSLRQRWHTLEQITWCLIERQGAFLERGNGALAPLTRSEVAELLGVHPSTVGRAVAEKYVRLPTAEVVPFATFFTASLSIKATLQEVLGRASGPLSDRRLAELLAARGIQVARRTVAKYRSELRQPAAFRRLPGDSASRPGGASPGSARKNSLLPGSVPER
jgi:RNA polymerase sigma-54 factor